MIQTTILDLKPGLVPGVEVQMPGACQPYHENYFTWTGSSLVASFNTAHISGGVLQAKKAGPVFAEVESHVDAEMFYFVSGVAIMPFVDIRDGQPDMDSLQIVRALPGTQIVIPAGKAHFVAVAEGDEAVEIIVGSPKMDAPRMKLPEEVMGVG